MVLTKVPSRIQVRIVAPKSEETVPFVHVDEAVLDAKIPHPAIKTAKKTCTASIVSVLIGLSIYAAMKMVGLDFGRIETPIIIALPALLGFLASFVLF